MRHFALVLLLGLASCSPPSRYDSKTQREHAGLVIVQIEIDRSRSVMADPDRLIRPPSDAVLAGVIHDILVNLVHDEIEIHVSYEVEHAVLTDSVGDKMALTSYSGEPERRVWVSTAQPGRYRLSHVVATPVVSHPFEHLEGHPAGSDSLPEVVYLNETYINRLVGGPLTLSPPVSEEMAGAVLGEFEANVTAGGVVFMGYATATEQSFTIHQERGAEIEALKAVLRTIQLDDNWKSRPWVDPLKTRLDALGATWTGY